MLTHDNIGGGRSRAVHLLDRVTHETCLGQARRLARAGELEQMYKDVLEYVRYVESLKEPEYLQARRCELGLTFLSKAAFALMERRNPNG